VCACRAHRAYFAAAGRARLVEDSSSKLLDPRVRFPRTAFELEFGLTSAGACGCFNFADTASVTESERGRVPVSSATAVCWLFLEELISSIVRFRAFVLFVLLLPVEAADLLRLLFGEEWVFAR